MRPFLLDFATAVFALAVGLFLAKGDVIAGDRHDGESFHQQFQGMIENKSDDSFVCPSENGIFPVDPPGSNCTASYVICVGGNSTFSNCTDGAFFDPILGGCVSWSDCMPITTTTKTTTTTTMTTNTTSPPPVTTTTPYSSTSAASILSESKTRPDFTLLSSTRIRRTFWPFSFRTTENATTTAAVPSAIYSTGGRSRELCECIIPGGSTTVQNTVAPTKPPTDPPITNTTPEILTTISGSCSCIQDDYYQISWEIPGGETQTQPCPEEWASGMALWTCEDLGGQCRLNSSQPDYSGCQSLKLDTLHEAVHNPDEDLVTVWTSIVDFVSDKYFGQEIEEILGLVTDLMDRQDCEIDGYDNQLEFQINTTRYGTEIVDKLISNDFHWFQLPEDVRSIFALRWLSVSEDVGFRLSSVAQMKRQSLLCESLFPNVTISSSYWDGVQSDVQDCDLVDSLSPSAFVRFPASSSSNQTTSYLLLPEDTVIVPGQTHKATGVLVKNGILNGLLPGSNNPTQSPKQINSPIISYTLYDDSSSGESCQQRNAPRKSKSLPTGSSVQLVYEHTVEAKYPPVRTVLRWLNPGETPSPVIKSSYCSYLSISDAENNEWMWDGQGCRVESSDRTQTVCRCDHLTNFADLMDFHDYVGPSRELDITSMVCTVLSIISLVFTFIVLRAYRSVKTKKTFITQNLCVALTISYVLILTTFPKHQFYLDEATCAAMGIVLHFTLLVSLMWMGVEGIRLFRVTVVDVFDQKTGKWWSFYIYLIIAYVTPLVLVGVTILVASLTTGIIAAYSGDETCWLVGENFMWGFAGPVAVIMTANLFFVFMAIRAWWKSMINRDRSFKKKIGKAIAFCFLGTNLMGISWLTGFFLLYAEALTCAYIFAIANGLQGVDILLFECLLNAKVRKELHTTWNRLAAKIRKWYAGLNILCKNNHPSHLKVGSKWNFNLKISDNMKRQSVRIMNKWRKVETGSVRTSSDSSSHSGSASAMTSCN